MQPLLYSSFLLTKILLLTRYEEKKRWKGTADNIILYVIQSVIIDKELF